MVNRGINAGNHGNFQENFMKQFQNLSAPLFFIGFVLSSIFLTPREQNQVSISFTELQQIGSVHLINV